MWVERYAPNQGAPDDPYGFIQWKGTDVCIDFHCECGEVGHFDGYFASILKCPTCERLWELPHYVVPRLYISDGTPNGEMAAQNAKEIDIT